MIIDANIGYDGNFEFCWMVSGQVSAFKFLHIFCTIQESKLSNFVLDFHCKIKQSKEEKVH